jgi:hypothetical protein
MFQDQKKRKASVRACCQNSGEASPQNLGPQCQNIDRQNGSCDLHARALSDPLETEGKEKPDPDIRQLLQLPFRGQARMLKAVLVPMQPPATPRQL